MHLDVGSDIDFVPRVLGLKYTVQTHLDLEHVLGVVDLCLGVEDLAERPGDDSRRRVGLPVGRARLLGLDREPLHRVRLSRPRLAVREHRAVVAAQHLIAGSRGLRLNCE